MDDDDWAEIARFVLPEGSVGTHIQAQLSQQRMRDLRRVTHVTATGHRSGVYLLHREEFAHEVLRGEHDERETSDEE